MRKRYGLSAVDSQFLLDDLLTYSEHFILLIKRYSWFAEKYASFVLNLLRLNDIVEGFSFVPHGFLVKIRFEVHKLA